MARIGHVIYKANDLEQAVAEFRAEGFEVEYGKVRDPHNALIYFSTGPYVEIIAGIHMPAVVRGALALTGHRRMVEDYDRLAQAPQGYSRIVFEVEREKFTALEHLCAVHDRSTVISPVARKDPHGRRLSCRCLVPDDWSVPMFVTPFAVDTHRASAHPNGFTRIEEIRYAGSETAVGICLGAQAEERLRCSIGDGTIEVSFA